MNYEESTIGRWFRSCFSKPTASEMAQAELEDSYRSLLECQRMKDYYDNMVTFHTKRITSLSKTVKVQGHAVELYI